MEARTRGIRVNYRELACVDEKLPRLPRKIASRDSTNSTSDSDANNGPLYPISQVKRDGTRVLVDLINMPFPCLTTECYGLHQDLALKIKSSLTSKRKSNPIVRVDMPFDLKIFCQGLQCKGTVSKTVKGITYYKIRSYKELDELLGHNWHYRGINSSGDFCFVMLETVEYHLYRRRPLIQQMRMGDQYKLQLPKAMH